MTVWAYLLAVLVGVLGAAFTLAPNIFIAELPDRLAVIDPSHVNIDNYFYDHVPWWKNYANEAEVDPMEGLKRMNPARIRYFTDVISASFGQSERNLTIVDLGCGGGLVTLALVEMKFRHVVGVDMSKASLAAAEVEAQKRGLSSGVEFIQGDLTAVPLESNSVDIIVMSDVLEHLLNLPAAMLEVHRLLKKGGILVFDTMDRSWYSFVFFWLIAQEILQVIPPAGHDWKLFIQPSEVARLCDGVGMVSQFSSNAVSLTDKQKGFPRWVGIEFPLRPTLDRVWRFVMTWNPFVLVDEARVNPHSLMGSYAGWCQKGQS